RSFISQGTRDEPRHCIYNNSCAQFSATQDVIPYRDFPVSQVLSHAFVYAFIASAEKHKTLHGSQFLSYVLRKQASLRRKQDHCFFQALRAWRNPERLHTGKDGFRLEHHAFASAKRTVIHRLMPV